MVSKSCVSYLEEDTLAWDSLHHPSQAHSRQIAAADRIEHVVALEPRTRESQHEFS